MQMNQPLQNSVVIITGATAGIGKAIALTFARCGAHVIAVGTNEERGQEVVRLAKEAGSGSMLFVKADISKKEEVSRLIEMTLEKFQKIDVLVNNAGITKDGLLMRMPEDDWDKVLDVNLKSCFFTCQAVMKPYLKAKKGKIINISSVVGIIGNPGQTNYAASKAGLIGFSKSLAKEVASRGITVNCIAPGYIETSMTGALGEDKRAEILKHIPLGRMGSPDDIANAALFLALPGSDYITGQVLVVDGGLA
jgi:3-oxoacyl-[acyl-carrier protein] reductase